MKVSEIFLTEIKIAPALDNPKSHSQYWAFFNKDSLHTLPHYKSSNSFDSDSKDAFRGGESFNYDDIPGESPEDRKERWAKNKELSDKVDKYFKRDYGNKSSFGLMLVDTQNKTVNLDMTKLSKYQNRRPNTKLKNFNHNAKDNIPILQGESGFERVLDVEKVLKALIKFDERVASFDIIGDDRFSGKTAQEVASGKHEVQRHSALFNGSYEPITFFHGTSMKRAKIILKEGFKTGKREDTYGDLIPNYSEHNIYLSLNPATAANYATREAINDSSDAVILKVQLKGLQLTKIKPDEDSMHWMAGSVKPEFISRLVKQNPILIDLIGSKEEVAAHFHAKNLNHKEQRLNLMWRFTHGNDEVTVRAKETFKKYGLGTDSTYDPGRDTHGNPNDPKVLELERKLYFDLMRTFIDGTYESSIKKSGNVAYPGNIPASQISMLKSWTIKGTKIGSNANAVDYEAALDKQAASVKK